MEDKARIADNGISDFTYRLPLGQRSILDRYEMEDISSEISSSSFSAPSTPPLPPSSTSSAGTYAIGAGGIRYIVHRVTMMDTLAGVAIKYGVEVADLKRINGLVTDRQMFAHKTLHIPLQGRHPPSPHLSNGSEPDNNGLSNSEQTPVRRRNSDLFETFQSLKLTSSSSAPNQKMSSAMNSLQGYYGLNPSGSSSSSPYNPPLTHHRKSKSLANGLCENGEPNAEADKRSSGEKLFRRRQKSETDFTTSDDNSSGGGFSATAGKGLALRSKPTNRTSSGFDSEAGWSNPVPSGFSDSPLVDDAAATGGRAAGRRRAFLQWAASSEGGRASSMDDVFFFFVVFNRKGGVFGRKGAAAEGGED
ncbi:uncharacterized protein LOC124913281 [Impatiens glandulifera]|uniref:uncharacterized protein LOC124913281 n=1 Tax=Impatiens glandulifera TaxID=253017 RepID=UPI001FB0E8FC|nr:uncharacterized protein LOC124913281 [Impatiens glandulifera]